MAAGDLWRVAVGYGVAGQSNVNVYHMKQTDVIGNDTTQAVADSLVPFFTPTYNKVLAAPRDNALNIVITKVSRIFSESATGVGFMDGTGDNQGAALPPANAVVVRLRTGLADRTRRGRVFIGGVGINYVQLGGLNPAGITKYNLFITELLAAFGGANPQSKMSLGVFSRSRYSIISNPFDDYWKPVTQLAVASPIATMRSRKVGVGA